MMPSQAPMPETPTKPPTSSPTPSFSLPTRRSGRRPSVSLPAPPAPLSTSSSGKTTSQSLRCRPTPARTSTSTRSKTSSLTPTSSATRKSARMASTWSSRAVKSPTPRRPTSDAPLKPVATSPRLFAGAGRSLPAPTRSPGTLRPSLLPLSLPALLARPRLRLPPRARRRRASRASPKRSRA